MNYRHDLLQWRRERTGATYAQLSDLSGLRRGVICDVVRGKTNKGATNPTVATIRATYRALGLDPKYALDFSLKKNQFWRAVVEAAR